MCGRMAVTLPPDAMAQLFGAAPGNDLPVGPNYNVCPTNRVAVVTAADSAGTGAGDGAGNGAGAGRRLEAMRWGFIPQWYKTPGDGPLLINARAETVAEKPAFAKAARERRGLIVASGFYEWTKDAEGGRDPWYITRSDGAPLAFAAVWQDWRRDTEAGARTCAVVTCAAKGAMTEIHHRVPVVVEPQDWPLWLGEAGHGAAPLMRAPEEGVLRWHRVSRAVNSNRAAGPELIEPFEDAAPGSG